MATIHREFPIAADAERAWAALRDVGAVNQLITFLGEVTVDGDRRTCEMGGHGTLDELIVSIDDERRRLAYTIQASPFDFTHHHASMQVVENGGTGATFVWTTDVKPDAVVPALSDAIDGAIDSLKQTLR